MAIRMKGGMLAHWHWSGIRDQGIINVLKKNINLERVEKVFHFLHQAGIKTLAFFMIGNYG